MSSNVNATIAPATVRVVTFGRWGQVVPVGEELHRAGRSAAALSRTSHASRTGTVVGHDPPPASVAESAGAAGLAAADTSLGLPGEHEPRRFAHDGQDLHPGHVEQGVGASKPQNALEATHQAVHVQIPNSPVSWLHADPNRFNTPHVSRRRLDLVRPLRPRSSPKNLKGLYAAQIW